MNYGVTSNSSVKQISVLNTRNELYAGTWLKGNTECLLLLKNTVETINHRPLQYEKNTFFSKPHIRLKLDTKCDSCVRDEMANLNAMSETLFSLFLFLSFVEPFTQGLTYSSCYQIDGLV